MNSESKIGFTLKDKTVIKIPEPEVKVRWLIHRHIVDPPLTGQQRLTQNQNKIQTGHI